MAETPKQSDQSMEEILQSIKRIIADEGEDAAPPASSSNADDEVLELTEMVTEDDAAAAATPPMSVDALLDSLADPTTTAADSGVESEAAAPVIEVLASDDDASDSLNVIQTETPTPDPHVEPEEQAPPPNEEPSSKNLHRPDEEGIASSKTLAASAAALKQLKPEPAREVEHRAERVTFRSGLTLEDLVLEALRPMLREWVDTNMPPMVERMVAKEIQKIRNQIS